MKDKLEGESQAQERQEILAHGDLYKQSDWLAHNNRISGILLDARTQLKETPQAAGTYQLIWFHATGVDSDLKYRQAFATFSGLVPLIALNPREQGTTDCFYFDYSAAINMPTVDALILTDSKTLQVCLNEFSHREAEFRETRLCRTFLEMDGVIDPVAMASEGRIISCRADVSRRNDEDIIKALQQPTGVEYSPIRLTRHAYSMAVMPGESREPATPNE